jgi:hypothetical protein
MGPDDHQEDFLYSPWTVSKDGTLYVAKNRGIKSTKIICLGHIIHASYCNMYPVAVGGMRVPIFKVTVSENMVNSADVDDSFTEDLGIYILQELQFDDLDPVDHELLMQSVSVDEGLYEKYNSTDLETNRGEWFRDYIKNELHQFESPSRRGLSPLESDVYSDDTEPGFNRCVHSEKEDEDNMLTAFVNRTEKKPEETEQSEQDNTNPDLNAVGDCIDLTSQPNQSMYIHTHTHTTYYIYYI